MSQQYKERDFGHWTVGDFIRCGDVMRNHNEMSEEISRLRAQLADAGNLWAHIKNRQYWDDVHAADMAVNGPTEFGVREGWTYINDLTRMLKGAAPPAGHFSCPYCPIEGITTKGEYEKHRATHEKPAAPVPEPDWEGIAASAAENRAAPVAPQERLYLPPMGALVALGELTLREQEAKNALAAPNAPKKKGDEQKP